MRTLLRRQLWRPIATLATAGALGAAALVAGSAAPAAAAGGCTAQYIVNSDWGSGFSIAINITNNGPAITSWTLAYSYSGSQQVTAGWSGTWSQTGQNVTVTNAAYNGNLATGTTIQIGANGSETATGPVPTVFTLNGTQCNGGGGSNTVTVTGPGNQSGTVGTPASLQIQASDSASGQTLTYTATGLPAGLSISSSGLITGTPTTAGTSNVAVTAKDGTGATGSATFTWTIAPASGNTVTVTGPGNQNGTTGTAVSLQIHATDSASGQTLTYTATSLPAGLSISSSGLITGTPTTAATSSVTVTAKDTTGASGSATFTWTISTSSGGSGSPMVAITSPASGQIFTPGSNITLQAAPVTGAGTITSVSFYDSTSVSNNNLIGTATSSPWAVQWTNAPAGSYSLTAVASNGSESLTSYPVGITVESPTVIMNPGQVAVQQGKTVSFGVSLSSQPSSSVTVAVAQNSGGDPDLSVSSGGTLTFTTSNWSVPQTVTIASGSTASDGGSQGTFAASASGYASGSATVTEALPAASQSAYDGWFLNLYDTMMNPANGYFSPKGIPYHAVETLIVEAPDYGHETTSETYSYYLWLAADYGRATGNWVPFNNAWQNMQQFMIPNDANQPGQCNASSPAQYGPEEPTPDKYPVALNASVPVGSDPLFSELKSTYGNCDIYQPMWIMDTDNRYGFGQQDDGTSTPSWINTFQRGPEESVWDTVPQPDWDTLKAGGPNGFLDLFNNGGGSFAAQYKYTDAPDADARMIQAAYWAQQWATAQGKQSQITGTLANAAKLGDFLRYSMFDKYFKQISANCSQQGSMACPAGTAKSNEITYLLSWFDAFGGAANGAWAWRISGTSIHEGYQNPLAAFALSTDSSLIPLSPSAKGDWATSLVTQLNLYSWLQSAEGGIAGGVTNNWGGNYGDVAKPPSGDPTFDGMYYDFEPQYHNPPSNQWFGYQTWPMERLAEYYFATGNSQAQSILAKWVSWAESVTTVNTSTGSFCLPGTLTWSGQPGESWTTGTSNSSAPPANTGLHVSVSGCSEDIGVATSLAKVYEYYAAKSGDTTAETDAQNILDVIHKFFSDPIGYSAPETRTDYKNFNSAYNTTNLEGVFIPASWTGKYPGGIPINGATNTFLSIRPWYIGDPAWSKVQAYLNGGAAPTFNYHRFWAEADVATAFDTFAMLFPNTTPPSGF